MFWTPLMTSVPHECKMARLMGEALGAMMGYLGKTFGKSRSCQSRHDRLNTRDSVT